MREAVTVPRKRKKVTRAENTLRFTMDTADIDKHKMGQLLIYFKYRGKRYAKAKAFRIPGKLSISQVSRDFNVFLHTFGKRP